MTTRHQAATAQAATALTHYCTTERVCAPLGRYWVDGARQVNSGGVYRAVCLACGGRILVKVQA